MNLVKNDENSNNLPQPVSGVNDSLATTNHSNSATPVPTQSQIAINKGVSVVQTPLAGTASIGQNDSQHSTDSPVIADDNDLIEQEWVDKAKAIIEKTREDPHMQNKEISEVKADYIKKRYNKEINVNKEK